MSMKQGRTETNVTAPHSQNGEGAVTIGAIEKKQKTPAKNGKNYKRKGIGLGGKRDKSGRNAKEDRIKAIGVSEMYDQHLVEEVEIVEVNKQTQERKTYKKPTVLALLDMLRQKALKDRDVRAAKEYLDRTAGRAKQRIEMKTEIVREEDQRPPTETEIAAAEMLLDEIDDNEEDD